LDEGRPAVRARYNAGSLHESSSPDYQHRLGSFPDLIETDILAKHIRRLLEARSSSRGELPQIRGRDSGFLNFLKWSSRQNMHEPAPCGLHRI
jgi:hypothetical protein